MLAVRQVAFRLYGLTSILASLQCRIEQLVCGMHRVYFGSTLMVKLIGKTSLMNVKPKQWSHYLCNAHGHSMSRHFSSKQLCCGSKLGLMNGARLFCDAGSAPCFVPLCGR